VDQRLAESVLASLPRRAVFPYFKDRYALQLLAYAAAEGQSLSDLRRGRFGPLLRKPEVRRLVGATRGVGVSWTLLDTHFPRHTQQYRITFGSWGSDEGSAWNQTTRPGHNLVVQLNFPAAHDRAYRKYIRPPDDYDPFANEFHPIDKTGHHTLAWARIDLDFDTGEALIEEVQTDWIRDAESARDAALAQILEPASDAPDWLWGSRCHAIEVFRYVEHVLSHHRKLWHEAVLAASLWVLREQLGLRRIYMHTHDTGRQLKGIGGRLPPRSLYEHLPRAFCFERAVGLPKFLRNHRLRGSSGLWCQFWYLKA